MTIDDLEPWARRALEAAYEARERERMSRDDFSSGWVAALEWVHSVSSFRRPSQVPSPRRRGAS